jgi:hypothetical protein
MTTPTPETVKQVAEEMRATQVYGPILGVIQAWADKLDPQTMTEAEAIEFLRDSIGRAVSAHKYEEAVKTIVAAHDARQAGKPAARGFDPICIERAKGVRP